MTTRIAALAWLSIALANDTVSFRDDQWGAIDQLVNQRGRVLCVTYRVHFRQRPPLAVPPAPTFARPAAP